MCENSGILLWCYWISSISWFCIYNWSIAKFTKFGHCWYVRNWNFCLFAFLPFCLFPFGSWFYVFITWFFYCFIWLNGELLGWFARDPSVLHRVGHVLLQLNSTEPRRERRFVFADDLFQLSKVPIQKTLYVVGKAIENLSGCKL